jgi:hypothetical protein
MSYPSARWCVLAVPLLLALLSGCVERTMVITSEPFGAIVFDERNVPLSATPADKSFTYYGKYRFTLVKDGYETLIVEESVIAPWYEWGPLEFISENLIPWTVRDVHRFHYKLQPVRIIPTRQVLEQGMPLRDKSKTIGEPLPPSPLPPRSGQPAPAVEQPGIVSNPGQSVVPPAVRPPGQ